MTKLKQVKNQKGTAMVETLPILVIFIVLLSFALGMFGVVHTSIMNSMAARTYAFETFRNRSDTILFRDRKVDGEVTHYANMGNRFHTVDSEKKLNGSLGQGQFATSRDIGFGKRNPASALQSKGNVQDHNNRIYEIAGRNRQGGVEVTPAWVMVGYGLCINARCGD